MFLERVQPNGVEAVEGAPSNDEQQVHESQTDCQECEYSCGLPQFSTEFVFVLELPQCDSQSFFVVAVRMRFVGPAPHFATLRTQKLSLSRLLYCGGLVRVGLLLSRQGQRILLPSQVLIQSLHSLSLHNRPHHMSSLSNHNNISSLHL